MNTNWKRSKPVVFAALREMCLVAGCSAIVYGVTLYDHRAGWIVGGLFLVVGSVLGMIRG